MQSQKQIIGSGAETRALEYLLDRGLSLRQRNFSCKMGEIDLIMQDKEHVVFVEVRFRNNTDYGGSLLSITPAKKRKIILTAKLYLQIHKLTEKTFSRFDVIAIDKDEPIDWIQNAF